MTKIGRSVPKVASKGNDGQIERLGHQIEAVASREGKIVVGPFTGEVGFELLYWIPLVRWAVKQFPQLEGRLIVVSRGGVEHWWKSFLDVEYVDIFSLVPTHEYVAQKGADKQRIVKGFDQDILDLVRTAVGVDTHHVLHPSLLFNFYYRVRKLQSDVFATEVRLREDGADGLAAIYDPIPAPAPDPGLAAILPDDDYVAVRFYFRESFQNIPETHAFVSRVIEILTRTTSVVLLNNRMELDDHSDALPADLDRVVRLDHLMTPENNLHVQSAAIGGARAFVGTYGGLSYLAPFMKVPAVGFSSHTDQFQDWHLALARRLFSGPAFAPLLTLRTDDLPLLEALAGTAEAFPAGV